MTMIKIYGRSLEDYKRGDPQGAAGYWADLGFIGMVALGGPITLTVIVMSILDAIKR